MMWAGVINNASGVFALLDIARRLKSHSKRENFIKYNNMWI